MASVREVYNALNDLANKDQRGFVTPTEFNSFAPIAQQNIFNRYVQRNARTCNEFGNQCGLMPETTGTGDNRALGLPGDLDEKKSAVIAGIYNTFNPNTAFMNALAIQRVPSWAGTGPNPNANITTYRNKARSDKRTLGYED